MTFRQHSTASRSIDFSRNGIAAIALIVPLLGSLYANPAWGQSNDGLRLGDPAQAEQPLNLGAQAPATAQGPAVGNSPSTLQREKVGDWDVACSAVGDNCAMAQIGNDSTGTPVLEMVVRKLAEPLEVGDRTAIAVLDVITPLGVVLTEGLSVTIDSGRKESAPFQICTEQGCLVREPVDNDLISRLKRGNNAVVSVVAANQGEVSATLSLRGFTKAYNGLK